MKLFVAILLCTLAYASARTIEVEDRSSLLCNTFTIGTRYPHLNPQRYYECTAEGLNLERCPPGDWFNLKCQACVKAGNHNRPCPEPVPEPEPEVPAESDEVVPDPEVPAESDEVVPDPEVPAESDEVVPDPEVPAESDEVVPDPEVPADSKSSESSESDEVVPDPEVPAESDEVVPDPEVPTESDEVVPDPEVPAESDEVVPDPEVPAESDEVVPDPEVPAESDEVVPDPEVPTESDEVVPDPEVPAESDEVVPDPEVPAESDEVVPDPEVPTESDEVVPEPEDSESAETDAPVDSESAETDAPVDSESAETDAPVVSSSSEETDECKVECTNHGEYLANPESCHSFYQCSWGVPYLHQCAAADQDGNQLVFDPSLNVCVWPRDYACSGKPGCSAPPPPPDCPTVTCKYDGQYIANPADCHSFYQCSWGTPYLHQCAMETATTRLVFNRDINVCDWSSSTPCNEC